MTQTQTTGITSPVILQRIVPETNTRRQYSVAVGRDLFGAAVVICRWGRIGQAGRTRTYVCPSVAAAQALAADVVARRRRRGYSSNVGTGAAHRSSKVRARGPSAGQTRRRVDSARAKAAAAQLPLFDADTQRPTWSVKGAPWQVPPAAPVAQRQAWAGNRAQARAHAHRPQVGPKAHARPMPPAPTPAPAPMAAPLMRLLGKPATAHERERWIEALTHDPRMQGHLRRGRDFGRL